MESITLPADLDALDPIADFVIAHARAAGLGDQPSYRLRLAVDELATNVILHGYEEHGLRGDITLTADLDDQTLVIAIEDSAVPYDPRKHDLDRVAEHFVKPLEERPIGGLGTFFVMQAVDDFQYEWKDGRNRSILTVNRQEHSAAPA